MKLRFLVIIALSALFTASCCSAEQSAKSGNRDLGVEVISSTRFDNGQHSKFELSKIKIEGHTYLMLTDRHNRSTSLTHDIKCASCTSNPY